MSLGSPFADVPAALLALVPEAADCGPGEPRADCARCPMIGEPAPWPWGFGAEARCCTYHPVLVNFLAGRALERGGDAAARVRARLADPDGVSRLGIGPPAGWVERYGGGAAFGRDVSLRCPYWAGGDHTCGVWHDRPAVCRTWFCKHDDGIGGGAAWARLGALMTNAEEQIAHRLCALGAAHVPAVASPAAWATWFRWCAARVDELDDADLAALATPALRSARAELVQIRRRPARPLAAVLVPAVTAIWRDDERVLITGHSPFDAVSTPPAVFAFLARLDGVTTWRDALQAPDTAGVTEATVRDLHRVGALRPVDGSDALPTTAPPPPHAGRF